jgi:rod shape determining protein RodA
VFFFGIGKEEKGSLSWIRFGSIGIQPSEFVKLLFSLFLSCELSEKIEKNSLNDKKCLLAFLSKCAVIIGLVILQNDTGTALVFVFMLSVTLFTSGISKRYIFITIGAFLVLIPLIWFLLADYQKDRILVFLNPEADLSDSGYQVYFAKLALSSGGIFGKGYKNGAVNALSYLPEKETDFIFSVIGEEFGLFGTLYFVALFSVLIIRLFYIAKTSKDLQGKILVTAICAMYLFHITENIGMTIGLLPVTGIPLPFVSYGGSSMLSMCTGAGLTLAVRRKTYTLLNS